MKQGTIMTDFQTQAREKIRHILGYCLYTPEGKACIHMPTPLEDEKDIDQILSLFQSALQQAEVAARIEEIRYYAQILKLNEQSVVQAALDGRKVITINLRKVFEYRLKQLHKGRRLAQLRTDAGGGMENGNA